MTRRDRKLSPETRENETPDPELTHEDIQQGSNRSIARQERLKRTVQQHPQRDLPRVESIDAPDAPPRI